MLVDDGKPLAKLRRTGDLATVTPAVGIYDVAPSAPIYCWAPHIRTSRAALVPDPQEFARPSFPIVNEPALDTVVTHLVHVVPL